MDSVISSDGVNNPSAAVTNYNHFQWASGPWTTTEAVTEQACPIAGTIDLLYVAVQTAPGSGKSFAFTIRKNGADTPLTTTIQDTNTANHDAVNSFAVSVGDLLGMKTVPSGTPTAPAHVTWAMRIVGTTDGESVIIGSCFNNATLAAGQTRYLSPMAASTLDATETNVYCIMPTAGVFDNLYVASDVAPGAGETYSATLVLNGVDQSLVATISNPSTSGTDTNGAHAVAVVAGDKVSIKMVASAGAVSTHICFGARWKPTVNGESLGFANHSSTLTQATTNYRSFSGRIGFGPTENLRQSVVPIACGLKKFYASAGPANGQTYIGTVRVNAGNVGTPSTMQVVITGNGGGTDQIGSDTSDTYTCTAGDLVSMSGVTSATSGTITNASSLVYYVAPSAASVTYPELERLNMPTRGVLRGVYAA